MLQVDQNLKKLHRLHKGENMGTINYIIKKFSSSESAIKFMNENYILHELIVSLTPTKYSNIGSYNEVR